MRINHRNSNVSAVAITDIADNLTTDEASKVLSANQGKILKDNADALADLVSTNLDVIIKNEVVNGDFSDDTIGWERRAGSSGSIVGTPEITIENDVEWVAVTVEATQATRIANATKFNLKANDKIYLAGIGKIRKLIDGLYEDVNSYIAFATNYGGSYPTIILTLVANQWSSIVYPIPGDGKYMYYMFIGSHAALSNPTNLLLRQPMVVNLTAIFGAGNEPSKEEMDTLIDIVGWWDGEITLTQKQQLIWTLNLIRANTLAIASS